MRLVICMFSMLFLVMSLSAQERVKVDSKKLKELKKEAIQTTENGDYRNGVKLLDHVISLDPEDHSLLGYRGICYFWTAKPELAMEDLNAAIEQAPSETFLFTRYAARPYNDIKGKNADLTQAIALNPENARCYYERGKLKIRVISDYVMVKDPEEVVTTASLTKKFEIPFDAVCEDFKLAAKFNKEYAGKAEHHCAVLDEAFNQ